MGRGIGQVFAQGGYFVTQVDVNKDALALAKDSIYDSLRKLEKKKAFYAKLRKQY